MQSDLATEIFQQNGVALAIPWYNNINPISLRPDHFELAT